MANNRIYIVCKTCQVGFAIAKWYPGAAYYTNRQTNKTFNEFLEAHDHGQHPFRLEYEVWEERAF